MRKLCSWTVVYCAIVAAGLIMATTVQARPNYLGWWMETYPSVAKKNNIKKSNCNVCHGPGSKKNRNDYGKAIAKALDGKTNLKKPQKPDFLDALKTAADQKSGTEGKTYGDLLNADELPNGPQ
jgi:maltose-binding protein MalE